jgi:hypothetical protein
MRPIHELMISASKHNVFQAAGFARERLARSVYWSPSSDVGHLFLKDALENCSGGIAARA